MADIGIRGLYHYAHPYRDAEETRAFYERPAGPAARQLHAGRPGAEHRRSEALRPHVLRHGQRLLLQFTSDMLPSDILGVSIWEPEVGEFVFKPGPLFANIVLADEINRTTPKTQSSLLEAMNESRVSLDHATHPLPAPFMVLATQNPREYEGTYPLPESQLDRFLLRIRIGYPGVPDEKAILRGAAVPPESLGAVLADAEVLTLQAQVERVHTEDSVLDYLMAVVAATRASPLLALGVSPRGSLALLRAAQAAALADGRDYLVPDDVKRLAVAALAHRVITKNGGGHGEAPGLDGEAVVRAILHDVPVPR